MDTRRPLARNNAVNATILSSIVGAKRTVDQCNRSLSPPAAVSGRAF